MNDKNIHKVNLYIKYGILGSLCYGFGDWIIIYGDPTHSSDLKFFTNGTANIPQWRYSLSMFIVFPGIIFYGIGLFSLGELINEDKYKKIYHYLNIFGLTS